MWKKLLIISSLCTLSYSMSMLVTRVSYAQTGTKTESTDDGDSSDGEEEVEATITVNHRANLIINSCRRCHALEAQEEQKTNPDAGPSLFGIVGRPVAQAGGYNYSDALKELGKVEPIWTEELLMAYLYSPKHMLRTRLSNPKARGKMGFRLNRIIDRQAVLKLLKTLKRPEE